MRCQGQPDSVVAGLGKDGDGLVLGLFDRPCDRVERPLRTQRSVAPRDALPQASHVESHQHPAPVGVAPTGVLPPWIAVGVPKADVGLPVVDDERDERPSALEFGLLVEGRVGVSPVMGSRSVDFLSQLTHTAKVAEGRKQREQREETVMATEMDRPLTPKSLE